ncbi:MAG: hypothetical protein J6J36_07090 [Clostridia bacterium]|nr:hypothetical protein [Clostridia bacterium]
MAQQIKTSKRKTFDDEFFTMYKDVVRELHKYDLRGKKIICPCDTRESNIYKYLKDCYYDVKQDGKEWRKVDYNKYDIVITNPPFSQVREFLRYLVEIKKDFIIIVSDVLRYSIKQGKFDLGIPIYKGWDAQKFYRPDGTIKSIHCGWISNIPDSWEENKLINEIK